MKTGLHNADKYQCSKIFNIFISVQIIQGFQKEPLIPIKPPQLGRSQPVRV